MMESKKAVQLWECPSVFNLITQIVYRLRRSMAIYDWSVSISHPDSYKCNSTFHREHLSPQHTTTLLILIFSVLIITHLISLRDLSAFDIKKE